VQGGAPSTLQRAKNLYLGSERTFWRRAQEAVITVWLEYTYTKEDILTLYLNRIYMGAGAYGFEAASQHYFDKSVREVNLAEAALLAGLIKAPSRFAPTNDLSRAQRRAEIVLSTLVENGVLTEGETFAARVTPATIIKRAPRQGSQYFVDWIASEVAEILPGMTGQLIIETTLDPVQQAAGELSIADAIAERAANRTEDVDGAPRPKERLSPGTRTGRAAPWWVVATILRASSTAPSRQNGSRAPPLSRLSISLLWKTDSHLNLV